MIHFVHPANSFRMNDISFEYYLKNRQKHCYFYIAYDYMKYIFGFELKTYISYSLYIQGTIVLAFLCLMNLTIAWNGSGLELVWMAILP